MVARVRAQARSPQGGGSQRRSRPHVELGTLGPGADAEVGRSRPVGRPRCLPITASARSRPRGRQRVGPEGRGLRRARGVRSGGVGISGSGQLGRPRTGSGPQPARVVQPTRPACFDLGHPARVAAVGTRDLHANRRRRRRRSKARRCLSRRRMRGARDGVKYVGTEDGDATVGRHASQASWCGCRWPAAREDELMHRRCCPEAHRCGRPKVGDSCDPACGCRVVCAPRDLCC